MADLGLREEHHHLQHDLRKGIPSPTCSSQQALAWVNADRDVVTHQLRGSLQQLARLSSPILLANLEHLWAG